MLTLFKKKENIKKRSMNEIIEEIHETFYTEVDRLIDISKQLNSLDTTKQALIDKRHDLTKLGFSNTKECKEANDEITRLNKLKAENKGKDSLLRAINHFSFKYPHYKFITEESVKKICQKYNLIYGEVSKYIGTVPDKNLQHIKDFKIKEEDACYRDVTTSYMFNVSVRINYISFNTFTERKEGKNHYRSNYESTVYDNAPLEIAAPLKDFNTEDMEVKGFKLSPIEIPDPVVLAPVYFEGMKHYLIVTAWGLEASDELVVNEKMN